MVIDIRGIGIDDNLILDIEGLNKYLKIHEEDLVFIDQEGSICFLIRDDVSDMLKFVYQIVKRRGEGLSDISLLKFHSAVKWPLKPAPPKIKITISN